MNFLVKLNAANNHLLKSVHISCLQYRLNVLFYLQELERLKSEGLVKHLGVSNFNERQIQRLLDNSNDKPEALQVIN